MSGDTDTLGDIFRAWREARKQKKAHNRDFAPRVLHACGVRFESKNLGTHLIVTDRHGWVVDYWPGTGLWIERRYPKRRERGLRSLLKLLGHTLPEGLPDDA